LKFVAIINGKKEGEDWITTFPHDESGPVPLIVAPSILRKPRTAEWRGPTKKNHRSRNLGDMRWPSPTFKKAERHKPKGGEQLEIREND
jgi:hypothetical protein